MSKLSDHIHERTSDALSAIPVHERSGIYVVSLLVYDEEDDPRRPTVTVGYNTESDVSRATDPAEPFTTDELEARWNYAFWRQNQLAVICDTDADPSGAQLREEWEREEGLWYADPGDPRSYELDKPLTNAFIRLLEGVVRRLQSEDIVRIFGNPLPVLIHELEYDDEIAEQNVRANPPGVVPDGFVRWCRGG